jgi:DNA-binding PadR family transcriptional regulator
MTIPLLDAAVLAAVAQLSPDAYGVTVRERVGRMRAGRPPSTGTIHLALTRLETAGLLAARASDPSPVRGGRAKRLYSVTAEGARALERARAEAERHAAALRPGWRPA